MNCILYVLLFITSTLLLAQEPGSFYVHKALKDQTYSLIGGGINKTNQLLITSHTYSFLKESLEIPLTKDDTILYFSNEIIVEVKKDSEFRVDNFLQDIVNLNVEEPEKLKVNGNFLLNIVLLKGEIEIVCPLVNENSSCIVQTSLVNLELTGGKYLIKIEKEHVLVYIINGNIKVHDNLTNKFEVIKSGNVVMIFQAPNIEKGAERLNKGIDSIATTIRKIKSDYLVELEGSINKLETIKQSVIFAVINKKVIGIRL